MPPPAAAPLAAAGGGGGFLVIRGARGRGARRALLAALRAAGAAPAGTCAALALPAGAARAAWGAADVVEGPAAAQALLGGAQRGARVLVDSLGAFALAIGLPRCAELCTSAARRGATVLGVLGAGVLPDAQMRALERAASAVLCVERSGSSRDGTYQIVLRAKGTARVRTRVLGAAGERAGDGAAEQPPRAPLEALSQAERAARAAAALSYEHQRPADAEAGMYDEADDVSDLEDELAELQEETDNTLII